MGYYYNYFIILLKKVRFFRSTVVKTKNPYKSKYFLTAIYKE